jgi:hypothetical protein
VGGDTVKNENQDTRQTIQGGIVVWGPEIFTVSREEANFDRACDMALRQAFGFVGLDDNNHCHRVPDWDRSTDVIYVEFERYVAGASYTGRSHNYWFRAWVERANEEE